MARRKLTEEEKAINKKRKEEEQTIKRYKLTLDRGLETCRKVIDRGDVRTPPYVFSIGDEVSYGAWEWSVILEVLDEGKFYKVLSTTKHIRYGHYVGTRFQIDYHLWTEIRPARSKEENEKIDILQQDEDIFFTYQQRDIRAILYYIYSGSGLDLNPDYQRDLVWTEEQKVALIDSIFKNIDIGKFTIIKRPYSEELNRFYEVLDGKQRIQALADFYECRFKYKDKTYNDLNQRDRNHFKGYSISWAETEPLTAEQKYRYFLKLNVSGTPMSQEHIEKITQMWLEEKEK